jgi:hypothetical protein
MLGAWHFSLPAAALYFSSSVGYFSPPQGRKITYKEIKIRGLRKSN